MAIGYFSFILFLIIILLIIRKSQFFEIENWPKKTAFALFSLKLLAAFTLYFLYTYYYSDRSSTDIYKYFDDAQHLLSSTKNDWSTRWEIILGLQNDIAIKPILQNTQFWDSKGEFLFNDNRTMTRINLVLLHFSNGVYHFHSLFFAFISFIGSFGIFKFFQRFSSVPISILLLITFLTPSFLFWTSAPLKESFLIFGLGLFLYGLIKPTRTRFFLLLIGLAVLISLKIYILLSIIPALLFFLVSIKQSKKKTLLLYTITHLFVLALLFLFQADIISLLSNKLISFKNLALSTGANSLISSPNYSTVKELFLALPLALFNVIIKPIAPPNWGALTIISAIEHLFFISVTVLPFIYFKKAQFADVKLFLFCFSFVIIGASIIGLTTPILGAIVRYKAPLIPFYLLLIFTFVDFSKLPIKFK